jgi:PAS domain-containing protein
MVPLFRNYAQHPETDLDFLDEAVFPLGRPVMSPLRRSSDASFGREVLEPANLSTEGLLLPLASSGALISSMLSIYCRKGFALERDGLELIRALTPWLLHAAQATTVLRHTESQMDGLRRSLDRFSVGVILLDDNAQIVFANRRAASLLERRHAPLFSGADDSAERCAALQEDVTIGTVRTRLKQVFAKTGTSRQASLVRLLLTENAQSLKPASGG